MYHVYQNLLLDLHCLVNTAKYCSEVITRVSMYTRFRYRFFKVHVIVLQLNILYVFWFSHEGYAFWGRSLFSVEFNHAAY